MAAASSSASLYAAVLLAVAVAFSGSKLNAARGDTSSSVATCYRESAGAGGESLLTVFPRPPAKAVLVQQLGGSTPRPFDKFAR